MQFIVFQIVEADQAKNKPKVETEKRAARHLSRH